jgi:hypothetical protein
MLTIFRITTIFPIMRGRVIAALVVLGWISLSCFDVLEDLDELSGQVSVATLPDAAHPGINRRGWGSRANNMVESASFSQRPAALSVDFMPVTFRFPPVFDLRRHFQLHKLYRVFLI